MLSAATPFVEPEEEDAPNDMVSRAVRGVGLRRRRRSIYRCILEERGSDTILNHHTRWYPIQIQHRRYRRYTASYTICLTWPRLRKDGRASSLIRGGTGEGCRACKASDFVWSRWSHAILAACTHHGPATSSHSPPTLFTHGKRYGNHKCAR
jgi:hypothetical protein